MDMATALARLGVTETSIDAETRDRLDREGYAPLPGVLSAAQLTAIRTRLAELLAAEGDQARRALHSYFAAEAGDSNSTRRSTPGQKPWPASARPPASSLMY